MGADIHVFVETNSDNKLSPAWWYMTAKDVRLNRWYTMFGALAGVRCVDIEPIAPRRGIPDGSPLLNREYERQFADDLHSWTWVTVGEYAAALESAWEYSGESAPVFDDYSALLVWCRALESAGHAVRLVIGFDS